MGQMASLSAEAQPVPPGAAPTPGLVGIGAVVAMDQGSPVVKQVLANNAAVEAGLKVNDVILTIDGRSVTGMPLIDVVRLIRGPAGSVVKLTVLRLGVPLTISITRRPVDVSSLSSAPNKP